MRPRSAPPAAQSHTHIAPAQQQVKPDQFIIGEEGQRVTTDTPDNPHQQEQPRGLRPLDRDGLRNAVIWGEILKPKF